MLWADGRARRTKRTEERGGACAASRSALGRHVRPRRRSVFTLRRVWRRVAGVVACAAGTPNASNQQRRAGSGTEADRIAPWRVRVGAGGRGPRGLPRAVPPPRERAGRTDSIFSGVPSACASRAASRVRSGSAGRSRFLAKNRIVFPPVPEHDHPGRRGLSTLSARRLRTCTEIGIVRSAVGRAYTRRRSTVVAALALRYSRSPR